MFVAFRNFSEYWRNTFSSMFPWIRAVSFISLLICFKILYTLGWVLYVSCSKSVTNLSQESIHLLLTSLLASAVFLLYSSLSSSYFEFNDIIWLFSLFLFFIWSPYNFKYFLPFRPFIAPKLSFATDFNMFFFFHSFSMSISFSFVLLKWSFTLCVYSHLMLSSFSNLTLKNSSCFNGALQKHDWKHKGDT